MKTKSLVCINAFFFLKELGKSLAFFVVYCTDIILLLCIRSKSDKEVGKNFCLFLKA